MATFQLPLDSLAIHTHRTTFSEQTSGRSSHGVNQWPKANSGPTVLIRCQPWRAKRRLVDPGSREAALLTRRA